MPVGTTPKNRRTVPKPSAGALRGDFPTTTGPQTQIHTRTGPAPQEGPSGPLVGPRVRTSPDPRSSQQTGDRALQRNDLRRRLEKIGPTWFPELDRPQIATTPKSPPCPARDPAWDLSRERASSSSHQTDRPGGHASTLGPLQTGAPAEPNPAACSTPLKTGRELRQRSQGTERVPNTPRGIPGGASDEREGSGSWTEISDPDQQPGDQNPGVLEPSGVGTEPNRLTWE
jgi:hypothetical protein